MLTTAVEVGPDSGPFAVDILSPPVHNPWLAQTRLTGFDFFDDGDRAAVCSWDGDVWLASGLRRMGTPARPALNKDDKDKGNVTQPGGFYRIRATGRPVHAPIGLKATKSGLTITFSEQLDPASGSDVSKYVVQTWALKRTANYGSKHFDEQTLKVAQATLSADRKTVFLELPDIQPTWCMSIEYKLTGSNGELVNGLIHNTIHSLSE